MTRNKSPLRPALRVAIEAAQEKQAAAVTLLNLEGLGAFTDYFLLCTGLSTRQVDAIGDEIEDQLAGIGVRVAHREGAAGAEWVLLDFHTFVVHVFTERARSYYDLERLWRSARKTEYSDAGGANASLDVAEAEG